MTVTLVEVQNALPAHLKSAASPQLVAALNAASSDPIAAQAIKDNFMSYTRVLKEGQFKTTDYLQAVMYVSYKLMNKTNEEAYQLTFPQRYQALIAANKSRKDISAYVSAYNKGKLVNLILEQTLVPSWVLNQDVYQKAINVQADLMLNANSEKVRSDAANSLLTHLKKPEASGAAISLEIKDNSGMNELKQSIEKLAMAQQEAMARGAVNIRDILASPIIEGESKEVK